MLRISNLRNFGKFLVQRPVAGFTSEPNKVKYSWEGITDHADQYEKIKYTPPVKGQMKRRKEQEAFEKLKQTIQQKMERELSGAAEVKQETKTTDNVFAEGENPEVRKYDRVRMKELYFTPRINNLHSYNNRKNSYLTEFQGPFEIHDERVTTLLTSIEKRLTEILKAPITNFQDPEFNAAEVQQNDPQVLQSLNELREVIKKTNYRLFPNIALHLACNLRYKEDFAGVWEAMEQELFKVLHNMSSIEVAKLKFALGGTFPKAGSPKIHRALLDLAREDLHGMNASELLHTFHAFRLLAKDRIYTKIVDQFLKKGKTLVKGDPDAVANLLYTYANCRQKKHQRLVKRDPIEELREANALLEQFLPEIEEAIPNMSLDALTRLSLTMLIVRTKDFNDIIAKIDRTIRKKAAQLDAFQTANIIYAFSKMNEGLSAGKEELFRELEKNVLKLKDEFNHLELSRIYYAYTKRGLLSKDLNEKVISPWINKNIEQFNYAELANVAYGLMFVGNTDKELWRKFIKNVSTQKHRVPIIHYQPLKYARIYVETIAPEWDFSFYEDTCFDAERYFNVLRQNKFQNDPYFAALVSALKWDLQYEDLKMYVEWENLFIIDFAMIANKFAILIRRPEATLDNKQASPLFRLRKKLLEDNGWTVMDLDYNSYSEMGPEVRDVWLKAEVDKYVEKTKKNVKEHEEYRRMKVFENLVGIDTLTTVGSAKEQRVAEKLK
jgi:hypothetical protein